MHFVVCICTYTIFFVLPSRSGVFLREKNFTELLSGITRDESGRIVSAKATFITWLTDMNMTEALENPVPNRPEPINQRAFEFEGKMLDVLLNKSNYPIGNVLLR